MVKNNKILIILGKGWENSKKGKLSISSRINAIAAGILIGKFNYEKVILSGGKTNHLKVSEAEVMKKLIVKEFGIQENSILLEEKSLETSENAEFVKKILEENKLLENNLFLLTLDCHLERALTIFKNYGLDVEGIVSQEIVSKEKKYKNLLKDFEKSDFVKKDSFREGFLNFLLKLDPKAMIPRFFAHKLRS